MTQADSAFTGSIPELYDLCLGPMLFEPYALDLGRRFEGFNGALLETAAGTGRATRALARAVTSSATITATDLSAPMLARAAQVVTAPNITWRVADALALPFADASFDAVASQFGVMFFPDKVAGFAEALRVLKPGGRLVFSVWDRIEDNDVPLLVRDTVTALFADDPPGFFARGPFSWHDKTLIHATLGQAGFGVIEIDTVQLPTPARSAIDAAIGLCSGSPLGVEIEARRPGGLDATVQAVAAALTQKFGDGPFAGQGQALLVTARL